MRDERGQLRQHLVEPALGGEQVRVGGEEASAVAHEPDARFVDHVGRAREDAAGRREQVLVEGDVDGVEERRDLVERPVVEGAALPEPRAVEVERGAACARGLGARDQIVPRRQPTSEVALRQLEQHRGDGLPQARDVLGRREPFLLAEERGAQAVQPLVPALLVHVEVAARMERDHVATCSPRVHAERDLLRHRAARHPDRRLLGEQPRDAGLEPRDQIALAVPVGVPQLGRALGERDQRRPRVAVGRRRPDDETLAARPDGA